jgi:hypothetical protein
VTRVEAESLRPALRGQLPKAGLSAVAAKAKADLLAEGAVMVTVDEQIIVHARARMPGIFTAVGLEEKLIHYWHETENEPVGDFRIGVLAKAAQLEEQALLALTD